MGSRPVRQPALGLLILLLAVALWPATVRSAPCTLAAQHVGLTFPVEQVSAEWVCRLQPIIDNHTTARKIGPITTALTKSLYIHLLDHPHVAAALINRLDLAPYKAETREPGRYWGSDGEGTEGIVQLVYQDHTSRIYYLEGSHQSRLLPNVTGKAVIFLRMAAVKGEGQSEAMESTIVSYTRLDSRVLAGMVSLLRPLVGSIVGKKLAKGIDVVNRLGLEMRQHPDRVMFEATDPPPLEAEEVDFLRQSLAGLPHANRPDQKGPDRK